jgi:hypothetical protein
MGISIITKPEEKHLPWWKRSNAPWWLIPLFACYVIYNVVTVNQASKESFEKFVSELSEAETPIKYYALSKVTEDATQHSKQFEMKKDVLECLLNAIESSKRPPSNDYASFLNFELAGNKIQLEVRQYNEVFWYMPWVKQEIGYKGYGFTASGKCKVQIADKEI